MPELEPFSFFSFFLPGLGYMLQCCLRVFPMYPALLAGVYIMCDFPDWESRTRKVGSHTHHACDDRASIPSGQKMDNGGTGPVGRGASSRLLPVRTRTLQGHHPEFVYRIFRRSSHPLIFKWLRTSRRCCIQRSPPPGHPARGRMVRHAHAA